MFAGHEAAVSGHQQDGRTDGRAQVEQALGAVGDQNIGVQAEQWIIDRPLLIIEPPPGQYTAQQFRQTAAGGGNRDDLALQGSRGQCPGVTGQGQLRAELAAETGFRTDG
ncbi:hypothetical protein D3C76_1093530 [compost metagenome]